MRALGTQSQRWIERLLGLVVLGLGLLLLLLLSSYHLFELLPKLAFSLLRLLHCSLELLHCIYQLLRGHSIRLCLRHSFSPFRWFPRLAQILLSL